MIEAARADYRSLLKDAFLELKDLRLKQEESERLRTEPVAVIGIGCRFPGPAGDPETFWGLLAEGVDAVTEIPAGRWDVDAWFDPDPAAMGKMCTRWGGFLNEVDRSDTEFFGISPREAASMDPQQRLLLEVSWEALENAGMAPESLFGSQTGVYVGMSSSDYSFRLQAADVVDPYVATGNAFSVASGRLSYVLGLQGPNLALDTACSSSLVAVHLACQSLRNQDCSMALAGGVNLILSPVSTVALSALRALSPQGRCKTFDEAADGFVRGEGCGVIVLKLLSDAMADGDRILALIRGSAFNHDGRSGGLTAPNGPAQEAVIRRALAAGGVAAAEVQYVEAHGTGTALGDPIEVQALAAVLGEGRNADRPLAIGSVKTNIGHLEAAAGIAGLIKTVLALQHQEIPPHLHLKTRTPHVAWDEIPVVIPTERTPWPASNGRRIAGVSSFGFSGTNAHVVLEEAPPREAVPPAGPERPLHLLTLSAKSNDALLQLAARYADHLAGPTSDSFADMCFTANCGRARFNHRLALVAGSAEQAREKLAGFARGEEGRDCFSGEVESGRDLKLAFLFTGQGSQYVGMGRLLYETQPTFRKALERCDEVLGGQLERRLLSVLYGEPGEASPLGETGYTQPALFAVEFALAELWRSWGVTPRVVAGHSVGEYVAACVAGVFSLEDGIRLVAERGRLMQQLAPRGSMVAVFAPEREVRQRLERYAGWISVAAVNGAGSVVISGEEEKIGEVVRGLESSGIGTQPLRVSHGFHSPLMESILPAFAAAAEKIRYSPPQIALVSNVTGRLVKAGEVENRGYWVRQLRETVQFARGMETLREQGCRVFLEIGPKPTLIALGQQCLGAEAGVWLGSLREGRNDWHELLTSLATLYRHGMDIRWEGFDGDYHRHRVSLPTYPFQRKRYWFEKPSGEKLAAAPADQPGRIEETIGGTQDPGSNWLYEVRWEPRARADAPVAADFVPAPRDIAAVIEPQRVAWNSAHHLEIYAELIPQLDQLAVGYIAEALAELGWQWEPGRRVPAGSIADVLSVAAPQRRLLTRLIGILEEEGFLRQIGDEYQILSAPDTRALLDSPSHLMARYPDMGAEVTLLDHCGRHLAGVLSGKNNPLEVLFPGGSLDTLERLYRDSPASRACNSLVQWAVSAAIDQLPQGRTLRVLELGAGTGSTTSFLLPALPPLATEYVFTDISPQFTSKAAAKFHSFPFLRYEILDIERDPAAQGFPAHRFDLVVAANVLHATADLRQVLRHVGQLLAPQGLFLMLEGTGPQRWLDLIFGMTEGWWKFADDDVRASHPLLSQDKWIALLEQCGFRQPVALPGAEQNRPGLAEPALILAQAPEAAPVAGEKPGKWLIFADQQGVAQDLAAALRASGEQTVLVFRGEHYDASGQDSRRVNPASPADFHRLVREVAEEDASRWRGVVHFWSLDSPPAEEMTVEALEQAQVRGCGSVLHLVQGLVQCKNANLPRLWLITCGAQPAGNETVPLAVAQAPLWGLGRVVALEHPELWGGMIDLAAGTAREAETMRLLEEISHPDGEDQIALRGAGRYVARLGSSAPLDTRAAAPNLTAEGTYLVTGGLGDVGLKVADWLVRGGAKHLVLIGRAGLPEPSTWQNLPLDNGLARKIAAIQALERAGATVRIAPADVGDLAQMRVVFEQIRNEGPPLRGIIHAAAEITGRTLQEMDLAALLAGLHAKVSGTWVLHELTQQMDLSFFVLFSSTTSLLGSRYLAHYAAANQFLDAFAHFRKALGRPGLTINWGIWDRTDADSARGQASLEQFGLREMRAPDALAVLASLLGTDAVQKAVAAIDWGVLKPFYEARRRRPLLEHIGIASKKVPVAAKATDLLRRLERASAAHRRELLVDYLRGEVGKVLGLDAGHAADPKQGFVEMGIDSLMVMELLKNLRQDLGLTLYPKEIYERPSIEALATYLAVEVDRNHSEAEPAGKLAAASPGIWTQTVSSAQRTRASEERIPGVVFLLSSPRSGSTLLRVMMAGHPGLFCPPELHLLPFETMVEHRAALASSYLGEGLQRAFMELNKLSAEDARSLVDALAERQLSTQKVYSMLQELAPGRLLVDKSPSYAASLETLARAEALFDGAKYIHLVRHPYAVIESFVRNRLERILATNDVDPYDLAEHVWTGNNNNVLQFLAPLDPGRRHLIRYEELVKDPATVMQRLCRFLKIPFDEAVLKPYEGRRMTDGIYAQSLSIGDPNFLEHQTIDPALGEVWRSIRLPRRLGGFAQKVAAKIGYTLPFEAEPPPVRSASLPGTDQTTMRDRHLDVHGLGLCLCEWGPEDGPLILCLHGMLDQGAAWEPVAVELARRGFKVVAPDQRGHGLSGHVGIGGSYHLLDFLADLEAVTRNLGRRPLTLVGHSMGAALAAMLAGARPNILDTLVLIECPFPSSGNDGEAPQQIATQLDYLASPPEHTVLPDVTEAARRLRQSTGSMPKDLAVRLALRITEPCEGGVRWRWDARIQTRAGIAFHGIDTLNLPRFVEILRRIQAPVTLIHADESNFVKPEKVALMQAALSRSRQVILSGGHNLHLDASDAVADIIAASAVLH